RKTKIERSENRFMGVLLLRIAARLQSVCKPVGSTLEACVPRSLPEFDVLGAAPRALLIFFQPPQRKTAPLICRLLPHSVVDKRVALEDDLENPIAVTRSRDNVVDVCRDAAIGIWAGFDGVEFVAALRVGAHVTAQARIAIIAAVGRVVAFFVRMVDV